MQWLLRLPVLEHVWLRFRPLGLVLLLFAPDSVPFGVAKEGRRR